MAITYNKQLTAGTPENVNDVMANFNQIATDEEYAFSTYKELLRGTGTIAGSAGAAATVYALVESQPAIANVAANANILVPPYLDPADLTANTRTTKYRVRATLVVPSSNAPGVTTTTVGLYPITAVSGTAYTAGSVVAGSTVVFTTPAANSLNQGNSGDFTAPAAGYYLLCYTLTGPVGASSAVIVRATLQGRQV